MAPIPKPAPHRRVKNRTVSKRRAAKRRQSEAMKLDVYALVDARDQGRCRACQTVATEHHHLLRRSRGGKHTTANVCAICYACHRLEDARRLRFHGDADDCLSLNLYAADLITLEGTWNSPCPQEPS